MTNPVTFNIFASFAGALVVALSPSRLKARAALLTLAITFASACVVVSEVLKYRQVIVGGLSFGWFGFSLMADGASAFMAAVSSLVAFLIGLYSLEYMAHYPDKDDFYFWVVLFVASMMGLVFSDNLMLMFCFWEITSLCSWRLIGFYRHEKDIKAADKAFLLTFFAASVMLLGIISVYTAFGTLELRSLRGLPIPNAAAFLILVGILAKSAQLPLQTWLPDAGVAPTPVTALLHAAVLVKIGIYVFARVFGLTFAAQPLFLNACLALSVATILVGAAGAMVENNIKRILAYSTISQLGYILMAFSIDTPTAFKLALVYILAHSLGKAGLFLCAGIIEHKTGTKDITQLGGLGRAMPLTCAAFMLCAFSIIGIPPFLGFWPKFMTVALLVKRGNAWLGAGAVIGALFTLFYLLRLFNRVFLGEEKIKAGEGGLTPMTAVVVIFAGFSLFFGLGFKIPFDLVSALMP